MIKLNEMIRRRVEHIYKVFLVKTDNYINEYTDIFYPIYPQKKIDNYINEYTDIFHPIYPQKKYQA